MAAGLGFKDFVTGEVLTAADVDGYLMQGVWVFASAAARDAAVTSPQEGNFAYLKDTNVTTYYTGSAWANLDTTGMTNPMTTTGDTIYSSSGSTPARLGIGSTGQVLTVASGIPSWATPSVAASGLTYVGGTSFSGSSAVNINDVFSSTYDNYVILFNNTASSSDIGRMRLRVSGSDNTTSNYGSRFLKLYSALESVTVYSGSYWNLPVFFSNGCYGSVTVFNPNKSSKTGYMFDGVDIYSETSDITRSLGGGVFTDTTVFTGFTFYPISGTITGQIRVYGVANS